MKIAAAHRQYAIFGETKALADGSFMASGVICRPNPNGSGDPFETPFKTQEKHATEDSAYRGGMAVAKRLIAGYWAAVRPSMNVLLVEDNLGDVLPTKEAFRDANPSIHVHVAPDGVEAMAFLRREGRNENAPRPDLILLDLNLPKMDGWEVLAQIKEDERLKTIPIAILTSSENEADVARGYKLHANCYLSKPMEFDGFQGLMESINDFWLTRVKLQQGHGDWATEHFPEKATKDTPK